ncbi:hypothetical protein AQUCO_05300049v1 [Aquilegia coerulea]|uniref:Calycin-like protein n=1 Tax=Aquilegia coerulea TaxID=218851 RepID=A0A2G5CI24_AQUCA|nr:hypothetical protein AQUCO_05300049v1 [Aquilegia coerulea]
MQSPSLKFTQSQSFLGFRDRNFSSLSNSFFFVLNHKVSSRISCSFNGGKKSSKNKKRINSREEKVKVKVKEKENVWSIDNKLAKESEMVEKDSYKGKKRGGKRVKNLKKKDPNSRVMVSGIMLMEVETVMQTQEPVIRPLWKTFASSLSGIWNGVGAVFSPITAEMEPIDIGNKNENLYDCYTLSRIEAVSSPSGQHGSQIQRKINWVTLNPYGEIQQNNAGTDRIKDTHEKRDLSMPMGRMGCDDANSHDLPKYESVNFSSSDVMEEDFMGLEPGLVFFEDGSYSRGPIDIPVGAQDEAKYFYSPTFKFEQCLVKGCHKRLRIVHTIGFNNGGLDIQIMRVAVYEEQWVSPANLDDISDMGLDVKPFSQRKRIQPSDLTGSWKVFEVSATPIFGEETTIEEGNGTPYVYLCMETLKKRSWPETPAYFGEEEMLDMQDVALLWLPGGVTAYVDVDKDGILCIGVGWYSDEGINLVMERDYGLDGKLKEVRCKSEVKRRWSEPLPL